MGTLILAVSVSIIGLGATADPNYVTAVFPIHFILICSYFGVAFASTRKGKAMLQLKECAIEFATTMANVMLCLTARIPYQKAADLVDALALSLDKDDKENVKIIKSWIVDMEKSSRAFYEICSTMEKHINTLRLDQNNLFMMTCSKCKESKINNRFFANYKRDNQYQLCDLG